MVDAGTAESLLHRRTRWGAADADRLKPLATLSRREREVLALRAEGLTRKEIAARLNLTSGTVGGYLQSTFCKLDVDNVFAALRAVGWLSPHNVRIDRR